MSPKLFEFVGRVMRLVFFLSVFILFNSTKHIRTAEIKQHDERMAHMDFIAKNVKTDWERFLWDECTKFTLWDAKQAYIIFRNTSKLESEDKDWAKEWKWGRIISRGRYQISWATYELYRRPSHKNLKGRGNYVRDAHDQYINTEIFIWTMRLYYRKYKCFKKALSCHNVGPRGFPEWAKRRKKSYYHYYVNRVRRKISPQYKHYL